MNAMKDEMGDRCMGSTLPDWERHCNSLRLTGAHLFLTGQVVSLVRFAKSPHGTRWGRMGVWVEYTGRKPWPSLRGAIDLECLRRMQ